MRLKEVAATRAFSAAERGMLGDSVTRAGIRFLLRSRLRALGRSAPLDEDTLREGPIAPAPREANEQHYEVPAEFFQLVLGPWRKYSSGFWAGDSTTLEESEVAMLELTCDRAGLEDGQDVLDLGCGWGALSLFAAERYPDSRIVAVSHSRSQRVFIEEEASRRGLSNLRVITQDVGALHFEPAAFDRVVSVEMFEHMNNYETLMGRISRWMRPDARLFIHVFCHHEKAYRFSTDGPGDWMAREFFTGGLMPSSSLLPRFRGDLEAEDDWYVSGEHYARTSEAWLRQLDQRKREVHDLFSDTYGSSDADRWIERWRLFFLAVAETFAYRDGQEWGVAHHRFRKPASGSFDVAGPTG